MFALEIKNPRASMYEIHLLHLWVAIMIPYNMTRKDLFGDLGMSI